VLQEELEDVAVLDYSRLRPPISGRKWMDGTECSYQSVFTVLYCMWRKKYF